MHRPLRAFYVHISVLFDHMISNFRLGLSEVRTSENIARDEVSKSMLNNNGSWVSYVCHQCFNGAQIGRYRRMGHCTSRSSNCNPVQDLSLYEVGFFVVC
jgi:hypothetical protein